MMRHIQFVIRERSLALFVAAIAALVPVVAYAENQPPTVPSNPAPVDGAALALLHATLSWQSTDPDLADPDGDDYLTFDLYFGDSPSPPLEGAGFDDLTYDIYGLSLGKQYYWKVVAHDLYGHDVEGPVWTFSTRATNQPPVAPFGASPANNATSVMVAFGQLSWQSSDPDGDIVTYDVYFGTSASPPLVKGNAGSKSYNPGMLQFTTTYYWKIVARDELGAQSSSPVWKFTTIGNTPPRVPYGPTPPNARPDQSLTPILRWSCFDSDFELLHYDVYFGTEASPPLVATNISGFGDQQSYSPGPLVPGTIYRWKIVARDTSGATSTSPVWYFETIHTPLPVAFSRFEAVARDGGVHVTWELHSDEAMESYTIYRRTSDAASPVTVVQGPVAGATGSYIDRGVEPGINYQYEMLIRTSDGDEFRSQTAVAKAWALVLTLGQNHPNPFNPQTTIPYAVPETGAPLHVRLSIYDASGRVVRVLVNREEASGSREVVWNGDDATGNVISSGIYFCVLEVGKDRRTQKLVLLK